jgi:hypothetical protein
MSSVRNPVGPQSASVYWRRRIFALLGLVAVIVVIVLIVTSLQSGGGGPTPSPTPSGTTSAPPAGSGNDADACDPGVITLEPITDAIHYAAGVTPMISMRITNIGSSACTLDVGTAQQEYVIVSGSDPIWNSRDCQTDSESLDLVLEPNNPVTSAPFPWDRTRSSTSSCNTGRPEVIAAGSTYRLSVKLGDLTSAGDVAFILD